MSSNQKIALVTGGLYGIGRAIVEQLVAKNILVYVFDIVDEQNEQVAALIKNKKIYYIRVDISDPIAISEGFTKMFEHQICLGYKKSHLDILINNAGITRDTLVLRMSVDQWDEVMNVNLRGSFLCTQQALKIMIRQNKSYIINMSSIVGQQGNIGQSNYAASKAGVIALTKSLAREYASRNILINAIAPGMIETAMTNALPDRVKQQALAHISLKRMGKPDDIAHLILFLTSGHADYITGQVINVDGGML